MFESLTERLQESFRKLRGKGRLTERDVEDALREVRVSLLEADVNFKVAKEFIRRVRERAVGEEVLRSLSPAQQVIKVVNEELTRLLGGSQEGLRLSGEAPVVIMMAGLQGSGKTTSAAKLASHLKNSGKRPVLAAGDLTRPAAVEQLQVLGGQVGVPVVVGEPGMGPLDVGRKGLAAAREQGADVLIVDTAGRLHVDEALMDELAELKEALGPAEILFVADAMTGQDAVHVADSFNERLEVTGVVLTKLDGDARGGAALSIRHVTGRPIKFVGTGEKTDALEPFYPDRMASRILGMGDVLTLIEKAQATVAEEDAAKMAERLKSAQFTLEDFLEQLSQVKKMGPLDQLMGMIPGLANNPKLGSLNVDDGHLTRVEAMIQSMTVEERRNPSIINGSRRKRIAAGSGARVQDVNRLLKQYDQAKSMMRQLGRAQKMGKGAAGSLMNMFRS